MPEVGHLEITLCEFNVENLFISMDYYDGRDLEQVSNWDWREFALAQMRAKQKPLAKVWGIAAAIRDMDPDVLMLVEVGGEESLINFNLHFLGNRYEAFFVEGNSQRGIDLGFLVKRGLPLRAEAFSNRDTPVEVHAWNGRYVSRFSRDVAELHLQDESGLRLILLLAHLKSKLSTDEDIKGKDVRTAEAIALAGIYSRLRSLHPEVPIVVGGDFNADISSLELELLNRTDLIDFQDILGTSPDERFTFVHFSPSGTREPMTLDYLLVSPHLKGNILAGSGAYRYKGFYGIAEEPPSNPRERYRLPSDHYPLLLKLRF